MELCHHIWRIYLSPSFLYEYYRVDNPCHLAIIFIAFKLYRNRYKILFKRQVKMLSTICEKSSDDSHIMYEEQLTESFDSG